MSVNAARRESGIMEPSPFADPGSVMFRLDLLATELDERSKELADTERKLEPVEADYEQKIGDWEANLWESVNDDGGKWPSEKLRMRLAHRALEPTMLGSLGALRGRRKRLEQRIGSIKVQVDAQRSILSALKAEMEASR